jgi:hypothetical protein
MVSLVRARTARREDLLMRAFLLPAQAAHAAPPRRGNAVLTFSGDKRAS